MEVIKVPLKEINKRYTKLQAKDAAKICNAIMDDLCHGGYKEGCRNNIAVDFTCVCHVLGIDADKLFKECMYDRYGVTPYAMGKYDDFHVRKEVIEEYCNDHWGWDLEPHGVFDKMFTDVNDVKCDEVYIVVD